MGMPAEVDDLVVSRHASPDLAWIIASPKAEDRCDDRAAAVRDGGNILLVIADGATGVGFGGQAADAFVETVLSAPGEMGLPDRFVLADRAIRDRDIDGDTTGIAILRTEDGISGCSAGDSEAWAFPAEGIPFELTVEQAKRPRIGNGARPAPFALLSPSGGVVVVASDGFWRWADPDSVSGIVARSSVADLPAALLLDIMERFGTLDDDVTIAAMAATVTSPGGPAPDGL